MPDDDNLKRQKMTRYLTEFPPQPPAKPCRLMTPDDYPTVAEVLFNAYHGTIDDELESLADALPEVQATMDGQYGPAIEPACLVGVDETGRLVSAIIATVFLNEPLLAYIVTEPAYQNQGWASALIEQAAQAVVDNGGTLINLACTEGNPAQTLYEHLGFQVEDI